jgi:hypothetical protein
MVKSIKETPVSLEGSEEILIYPDGEYNIEVLEKILNDAVLNEIDKNNTVVTIHNKRVRNFDPDNPEWMEVKKSVSLKKLFEVYKQIQGIEYKQPTIEELERKYRMGLLI